MGTLRAGVVDEREVLAAVDGLLFEGGWFAIDAANVRVPGVSPTSLAEALSLVSHGRVATVVGRLRPEVAVVDVDLAGELGRIATATLSDWCTARGLWHLVRESGGGPGRAHVFVAPGVHGAALSEHVGQLRAELRAGPRHIDLRRQVRPLSAPHRRGHHTPAPGDVDDALAALRDALGPLPERVVERRRAAEVVPITGPRTPLVPMRRGHRSLPVPWAAYLAEGRRAAGDVDRDPHQRSQIELEATFQFVICGYSESEAWEAITAAHPTAFVKARGRGRQWWWLTWNRAVLDADAWRRQHRGRAHVPVPEAAALRALVEATWRTWPARTRHTDREVALVVADVMDQAGDPAAHIAQRELLLQCAIASRTTLRQALERLQSAGVLAVEASYVPGTTDTSHTIHPGPRCETPGQDADLVPVSLTDPHRFQPPQPRPPLPLRTALGPGPTSVLEALTNSAAALPLAEVARLGGLAEPDEPASPRQLRTVREHLRSLGRLGLIAVDDTGLWSAASTRSAARDLVSEVGAQSVARKARAVAVERAAFRAAIDSEQRARRFEAQRAACLARQAKAARARQRAWWAQHDDSARHRLAEGRAAWFAGLSPTDQARRKSDMAFGRALAGEDERARYDAWLREIPAPVLATRIEDRASAFAAKDPLARLELVNRWTEHRARWGLPHRLPPAASTPSLPEEHLLRRPPGDLEEFLFEFGGDRSASATG